MRIEVTQADIDGGCREDANNCPVARAIARQVPNVDPRTVEVDAEDIQFTVLPPMDLVGAIIYECRTPGAVRDFIDLFDTEPHARAEEPAPFSFEIPYDPPREAQP